MPDEGRNVANLSPPLDKGSSPSLPNDPAGEAFSVHRRCDTDTRRA